MTVLRMNLTVEAILKRFTMVDFFDAPSSIPSAHWMEGLVTFPALHASTFLLTDDAFQAPSTRWNVVQVRFRHGLRGREVGLWNLLNTVDVDPSISPVWKRGRLESLDSLSVTNGTRNVLVAFRLSAHLAQPVAFRNLSNSVAILVHSDVAPLAEDDAVFVP